jgi:hypothetical protein
MTAIGSAWGHAALTRRLAGWSAVLIVAASCTNPLGAGPSPAASSTDRAHLQAQKALERWAQAVHDSGGAAITFVGELTSQIGDWEQATGDNNKRALMSGLVRAGKALSAEAPPRGEVKWVDGKSQAVNVLSAAAALDDLVAAGNPAGCDSTCQPLVVTDANLAKGLVETSLGPAEAPIWVFTIRGTTVRVTRLAVDDAVTVDPPPWNADDPPGGISINSATGTPGSNRLDVSFVGAPDGRSKPCGADYRAEAVESDLAVVVMVVEDRNPYSGACSAVGAIRTATAKLKEPLGRRTVLEVQQGLPVPLRAP